jgi:hypothetical protein
MMEIFMCGVPSYFFSAQRLDAYHFAIGLPVPHEDCVKTCCASDGPYPLDEQVGGMHLLAARAAYLL